MKLLLHLIAITAAITSCKTTNTKIREVIAGADSVAINYFKGDGSMDTVTNVRVIRDKASIEQLIGYISTISTEPDLKCGYDGSIHFFKMNMVTIDIYFRMNDTHCMAFFFQQEGKLTATVLSSDAKQFLNSINK